MHLWNKENVFIGVSLLSTMVVGRSGVLDLLVLNLTDNHCSLVFISQKLSIYVFKNLLLFFTVNLS